MEIVEFLRRYPPFSELAPDRLAVVAKSVEIAHFPAGKVVLRKDGPPATELHVIRKGAVELMDDGHVLDLLTEGETFGQLSLLAHASPTLTVRTQEDTLCYLVPEPFAEEVLQSSAGLSFVWGSMRRRLRAAGHTGAAVEDPRFARVGSLIRREPVTIEPGSSVADAAARMTEHRVSSLLIPTAEGWGIITDRDLRTKVVAARSDYDRAVRDVATFPAQTLPVDALAGEALLEMFARGIHHFPVMEGDRVVGVVTDTDLMGTGRHTPFAIRSAIERAGSQDEVIAAGRDLPQVVVALVGSSADPVDVGRVISLVVDALTERLLALAIARLGEPAVPFAWLALGSAARHEQSLRTDQDHALAYELPDGISAEEVDAQLHDLAESVAAGLEAVGIPRCNGDAMAVHPAMRRTVESWTDRFRRWMQNPTGDAAILSSIVLDFRRVAGALDPEPAFEAVVREGRTHQAFVEMLGRHALDLKPPTGFFRDFVVQGKGEHAGHLDVKHGGITIVTNLARAFGIATGSSAKGTLERLDAASAAGRLGGQIADDLTGAFRFLWEVRLRHQAGQIEAGVEPDDFVDPKALGTVDRGGLKEAFRVIRGAQQVLATELGVDLR